MNYFIRTLVFVLFLTLSSMTSFAQSENLYRITLMKALNNSELVDKILRMEKLNSAEADYLLSRVDVDDPSSSILRDKVVASLGDIIEATKDISPESLAEAYSGYINIIDPLFSSVYSAMLDNNKTDLQNPELSGISPNKIYNSAYVKFINVLFYEEQKITIEEEGLNKFRFQSFIEKPLMLSHERSLSRSESGSFLITEEVAHGNGEESMRSVYIFEKSDKPRIIETTYYYDNLENIDGKIIRKIERKNTKYRTDKLGTIADFQEVHYYKTVRGLELAYMGRGSFLSNPEGTIPVGSFYEIKELPTIDKSWPDVVFSFVNYNDKGQKVFEGLKYMNANFISDLSLDAFDSAIEMCKTNDILNGLFSSKSYSYFPDGAIEKTVYRHSEDNEPDNKQLIRYEYKLDVEEYYPDGSLKKSGTYLEGISISDTGGEADLKHMERNDTFNPVKDGKFYDYDIKTNTKIEGEFVNGRRDGEFKKTVDGKLVSETTYNNGKIIKDVKYISDGSKTVIDYNPATSGQVLSVTYINSNGLKTQVNDYSKGTVTRFDPKTGKIVSSLGIDESSSVRVDNVEINNNTRADIRSFVGADANLSDADLADMAMKIILDNIASGETGELRYNMAVQLLFNNAAMDFIGINSQNQDVLATVEFFRPVLYNPNNIARFTQKGNMKFSPVEIERMKDYSSRIARSNRIVK